MTLGAPLCVSRWPKRCQVPRWERASPQTGIPPTRTPPPAPANQHGTKSAAHRRMEHYHAGDSGISSNMGVAGVTTSSSGCDRHLYL